MGMGGGTGCLKAPYSRGRLSPRHFYPPSPLLLGCHAECVRVRVHFLVFSLPTWDFPRQSASSSAAKWILGPLRGMGFFGYPL